MFRVMEKAVFESYGHDVQNILYLNILTIYKLNVVIFSFVQYNIFIVCSNVFVFGPIYFDIHFNVGK